MLAKNNVHHGFCRTAMAVSFVLCFMLAMVLSGCGASASSPQGSYKLARIAVGDQSVSYKEFIESGDLSYGDGTAIKLVLSDDGTFSIRCGEELTDEMLLEGSGTWTYSGGDMGMHDSDTDSDLDVSFSPDTDEIVIQEGGISMVFTR